MLALIVAVLYWQKPLWHRAQLLYWQHRCLTYSKPPDTPVRAEDAAIVQRLRNDRDYILGPADTWANLEPQCWPNFENLWYQGIKLVVDGRGPDPATVFLHERRTPSGHRRLVHVQARNAETLWYVFSKWTVIRPATLFEDAEQVGQSGFWNRTGRYTPATVMYGQPDPVDPSHFTIDFVVTNDPLADGASYRRTVDAWLKDDDTIEFKERSPSTRDPR
jgi:hypothetical protein